MVKVVEADLTHYAHQVVGEVLFDLARADLLAVRTLLRSLLIGRVSRARRRPLPCPLPDQGLSRLTDSGLTVQGGQVITQGGGRRDMVPDDRDFFAVYRPEPGRFTVPIN